LLFISIYLYVLIQHCFICLPLDSTMSEDAGIITPSAVATLTSAVRRSNHSARSHPQKNSIVASQNYF